MTVSNVFTTLAGAVESGDAIRFWREPRYDGLECLSAVFRRHRYVPHTHETFAVAAVIDGCEAFSHRGARHYATPGTLAIVPPDEWHDGEPAGEGFVYRTIYPSVELMRAVAGEVFGRTVGTPSFSSSVVADPGLAAEFADLHRALAEPSTPALERDSLMTSFLGKLISRWGHAGSPPPLADETRGVGQARAYLDGHFESDVTLDELAAIAQLNRTHLVRAFRQRVGATPHAYLTDRRFRAACRLLTAGDAPASVAAACGFFDQSHLNRVFKRRMGVTPGQFRTQGLPR